MKTTRTLLAITCSMIMLGACGQNKGDRAASGALIGAGTGAVVNKAIGGSLGTGALIGAGVGAAAGAMTDEDDVNLGEPVWR